MEEEELLPKPQTDLPLPEEEISEHAAPASQGETFRSYSKTNIFKSKFFLGFVGISFLIAFLVGGFVLGKNNASKQSPSPTVTQAPTPNLYTEGTRSATTDWKTYETNSYTIKYPSDYQLNINKIVATEGIVEEQTNTIQLISPVLPNSNGNLSIIIAYKSTKLYLEQTVKEGSTCAELSSKKLEPVNIGDYTFSQSGLINCGPNQVAFFYILNGGNIYEAKVETTADYQKDALPAVKQILSTLRFPN